MLDVFVRKPFAIGTLRQAHAFAEGAVVGFGVRGVEHGDGVPAGYAYWHCCRVFTCRREDAGVLWVRSRSCRKAFEIPAMTIYGSRMSFLARKLGYI
jgi:hypothetical protein